MKHIVQFSGGKDSTAMLLMMIEREMPIDYILYCDTTVEFPETAVHIEKVNEYLKEYGKEITILKPEHSFEWYFMDKPLTRGKRAGQKGFGYPNTANRWCTSRLKVKPFKDFVRKLNDDYIVYIGIAADEGKRIKDDPHFRYPLYEWGVTEEVALKYCYDKGFTFEGIYDNFKRNGCYLCPLQNVDSWRTLYHKYPDLFQKALDMEARNKEFQMPRYMRVEDYKAQFEFEDKVGKVFKRYPRNKDKIKEFQDKVMATL